MSLRPTAERGHDLLLHPRHWPSWIGVGMLRLSSLLPVPVLWAGGVLVGELLYYLVPSRRRVVSVNIEMCFPELSERERRRLVKRHFRAFGQALLDIGIAWWARPARLRRLVRIKGREPVDALLAAGKRVIFMAPHFLGLEIGGVRISLEGNGCAMFRPLQNKVLNRVMEKGRTRFGLMLVAHKAPLTTLVRVMREGTPLFYLPDQDAHRRSRAFVPFFGIRTATFTTLSRFASLTDAVVVPLVCRQLPRGRGYEVVCRPPLVDFPSDDLLQDATAMNREIEQEVREAPHQYFWLHRRFKTRPPGEASLYG